MALLQLLVSPTANGGHMYNYRYNPQHDAWQKLALHMRIGERYIFGWQWVFHARALHNAAQRVCMHC